MFNSSAVGRISLLCISTAACGATRSPAGTPQEATIITVPSATSTAPVRLPNSAPKPATEQDRWWLKLDGANYQGQMWSGGLLVDVNTRWQPHGQSLRGEYVFVDDGATLPGLLSECESPGELQLRCRWRDTFGAGYMHVSFTQDLTSFEGHWSPEAEPDRSLHWSGLRHDDKSGP